MKTENQQFLEDLNKAFARSDTDYILRHVTDDIKWEVKGDFSIKGKEAFKQELKKMESPEPFELTIHNIITHGRSAAVDGTMTIPDGKVYAFCDLYKFSGLKYPKISEMVSYVVEVE